MLEVVLKDWVTETNETSCWSKSSTSLAKSASDRVNDNDLDLLGSDLFQQVLEGRPIERRAGEGAIIEAVGNEPPAFMRLALDIGLAGFALGVEGVEGEIEIMLGRFARVDRAALRLGNDRFHAAPRGWLAGGRALIDPDRGTGLVSAAAGAGSPAPAADASPEEAGPVPAGSSDLAGDGRQARKDLSLPAEASRDDQNLLQLALISPDADR